jgi:hypothetical protein
MTFHKFNPYTAIPEIHEANKINAHHIEELAHRSREHADLLKKITEYEQNVVILFQKLEHQLNDLEIRVTLLEQMYGSS